MLLNSLELSIETKRKLVQKLKQNTKNKKNNLLVVALYEVKIMQNEES